MRSFDDGTGPALYAGSSRVSKWNGTVWSAVGSGFSGSSTRILALAVHDDASGPALYAGGNFTIAGGMPANRIAEWDGASWSALGSGFDDTFSSVDSLAVFDDGHGPVLYAGGTFSTSGGMPVVRIGRWDGTSWSAPAGGVRDQSGYTEQVDAMAVFDDGSGPSLYVGGLFAYVGTTAADDIAKWDGTNWAQLGGGLNGTVDALAVFDDGGGPALFAGGSFTSAGGVQADKVVRWDDAGWAALGNGGYVSGGVACLATFDDGGGPALFAGGDFRALDGVQAERIAKWDGRNWAPLGSGVSGSEVWALKVHDDGSGPALFVGGEFTSAGGIPASGLAKWNGRNWAALPGVEHGGVRALAVFDDGGGPALYAGGSLRTVGDVHWIGKWDGRSWTALGEGLNFVVLALEVFDDGSGPALYVGGSFAFFNAEGVRIRRIAKWDGTSWSTLGTGMDSLVSDLTVFDDGRGLALVASGLFRDAGGVAARGLAKWDGASWSPLAEGLSGTRPGLYAFAVFDDGSGPALCVGGHFPPNPGGDSNLARWSGCLPTVEVLALAPDHGPRAGGNRVKLFGSEFVPGTTVAFGTEVGEVTFVGKNELDVVVPPRFFGRKRPDPVDVIVTTPYGGRDTLVNGYTYAP